MTTEIILGIFGTIIVPLIIVYVRNSKIKQNETVRVVSDLHKTLDRMADILNTLSGSQDTIKDRLLHEHADNTDTTLRLVSIETKLDNAITSIGQIHTRLDK